MPLLLASWRPAHRRRREDVLLSQLEVARDEPGNIAYATACDQGGPLAALRAVCRKIAF
jgi:hypothetical protein